MICNFRLLNSSKVIPISICKNQFLISSPFYARTAYLHKIFVNMGICKLAEGDEFRHTTGYSVINDDEKLVYSSLAIIIGYQNIGIIDFPTKRLSKKPVNACNLYSLPTTSPFSYTIGTNGTGGISYFRQ